jgi:capsular polysaccharide biosynthesis protein
VTLPALVAFLRRRIVPLGACLLAGLVGGLLLTAVTPKTYKASTRLFVNIPTARTTSEAIQGVQLSSNLLESYARIATSRTAAERVSLALNKRFTSGEIGSKLRATPQPNTLLIDVTATDRKPEAARDIADAGGKVLSAYVTELEAGREGAIEARVIDAARLPTSPSSPKASRNLAVGLLLGLVVGVGLALALDSSSADDSSSRLAGAPLRYNLSEAEPTPAMESPTPSAAREPELEPTPVPPPPLPAPAAPSEAVLSDSSAAKRPRRAATPTKRPATKSATAARPRVRSAKIGDGPGTGAGGS